MTRAEKYQLGITLAFFAACLIVLPFFILFPDFIKEHNNAIWFSSIGLTLLGFYVTDNWDMSGNLTAMYLGAVLFGPLCTVWIWVTAPIAIKIIKKTERNNDVQT